MYYVDYHTHSRLSPDSSAPLEDMVSAAVQAGLSELCVTDHYDLLEVYGKANALPWDQQAAVAQWAACRQLGGEGFRLKLGLELGSAGYDVAAARRTLDLPELDFVIGSLHNLTPEAGGTDFYYLDYHDPATCYAALDNYFEQMVHLAPLPEYDCLGHIIYPLRYMCMREKQPVNLDGYMDQIQTALRSAAETGHGIEINTYNGRSVADWKPILALYREVGGEILTVGSDAHSPENVAKGIQEAYALIASMGFRYVSTYEKRKPSFVKL